MNLSDILPDDILVFDEMIDLEDGYAINGMMGHQVFVIDCEGEVEEMIYIDDLAEDLKLQVIKIIEEDGFEMSHNE